MNAFKTSNSFVLKPIYSGTMTPSCEPFSEKLIRFPPTNLFTIEFFYIIINIAQQT
jgi:hypothetical protein